MIEQFKIDDYVFMVREFSNSINQQLVELSNRMLKVCLIGPKNSGKSSFISSIKNVEKLSLKPGGVHCTNHCLSVGSQKITLQYWQICGQKGYEPLISMFLNSSDIILLFLTGKTSPSLYHEWEQKLKESKKKVYVIVNIEKDNCPIFIQEEIRKYGWKLCLINAHKTEDCKELEKRLMMNILTVQNQQLMIENSRKLLTVITGLLAFGAILGYNIAKRIKL